MTIQSKAATEASRKGWEATFGKKRKPKKNVPIVDYTDFEKQQKEDQWRKRK